MNQRYRVEVSLPVQQIFLENWSPEEARDYIIAKADEHARKDGIVVEHCRKEYSQQEHNHMDQTVTMCVDYIQLPTAMKSDIITQ